MQLTLHCSWTPDSIAVEGRSTLIPLLYGPLKHWQMCR